VGESLPLEMSGVLQMATDKLTKLQKLIDKEFKKKYGVAQK